VFIFGFDPEYVERAPLARLFYWHERAYAFVERRQQVQAERRRWDELIAAGVKMLPRC